MRLLFVHQNFPGQYAHLAGHYGALPGNRVIAVGEKRNMVGRAPIAGVERLGYQMGPDAPAGRFEASFLRAVQRGRTVAAGAAQLRRAGFRPDLILAHIGWGEALFLKDIFPDAKLLLY